MPSPRRLRLPAWLQVAASSSLLILVAACGSIQSPTNSAADDTPIRYAASTVEQVSPAIPLPTPTAEGPTNESSDLWFVELSGAPLAEGGSQRDLAREQRAFRSNASRAGIALQERFQYTTLFNGFSVRVPAEDLGALQRLPNVRAVYPMALIAMPEPEPGIAPQLATALAMTGADYVQEELGFTGSGIRVAVMDSGVDYDHADLGGCFGPGCRVAYGYDFVGDAFNADPSSATYNPVPAPDDDPDDCGGHGTHVAGIVGANGGVVGVAPEVTFGAYRVFGCDGSTTADIMLAAMERALDDGMHILNMSIGAAYQWPQYPTAVAASRLVNRGMVVVASIGNSGQTGLYSAGAPGVGAKVIGVASFDNSHISALTFDVEPTDRQVPYIPLSAVADPPTSGTTAEVVFVGRGCNIDTYEAVPAGKVALIERGLCSFNEKYARAVGAGATGVVIHNGSPGLFAGGGVADLGVFGVGISQEDGQHIRSALLAGTPVQLTWTDVRTESPNPNGNLVSNFSSYGLAPDLTLKPDLGAPGGLIRSTYPLELGGYAILSGTSMAAPHVAGAAALLLEAHPNTPSQAVRGILQNSAVPRPWWGNPGIGFLDNVHRQGAGMVHIGNAIETTTKVEPAAIALGESQAGPVTTRLRVENDSDATVTYTVSHVPALSTGPNTFMPGFFTGFAGVDLSASTLTIPAGGSASFDATITANPALAQGSQYGGYLVITGSDGFVHRVPYAGFRGDYQSIGVLTSGGYGFPWLAAEQGGFLSNKPSGATYTMSGGDIPYFLVHLDHPSRRLRVEVFEANTGRAWHRAYDFEYLPRNSGMSGFFALPWDGVTTRGKRALVVPDGAYVVKVSVQKALGEDDNAAHWESWTSPSFVIDRP